MNTHLDCIPCLLKQIIAASRLATKDIVIQENILEESLKKLTHLCRKAAPPVLAKELHDIVKSLSDNTDPYAEEKRYFNALMLEKYEHFKDLVKSSSNPLKTSVLLSIAGNVIDFGAYHHRHEIDISNELDNILNSHLAINDFRLFEEALNNAKKVVIFGDNAGEIVLDTLLVKAIGKERVTYVVRGEPIINDATLADAQSCGMTNICTVIENGNGFPGTVFEALPKKLQNDFHNADVIIAKGQGNFETMCKLNHENLFFLLKIKCHILAHEIGYPVNSLILKKQREKQLQKPSSN
jgi:damage-control phosphatase, subfamily I